MSSVQSCHAAALLLSLLVPVPWHKGAGWSWGPRQSWHAVGPEAQSAVLSLPRGGTALLLQQPAWGTPCTAHASKLHSSGPKDCAGRCGLSRRHSSVTQLQMWDFCCLVESCLCIWKKSHKLPSQTGMKIQTCVCMYVCANTDEVPSTFRVP